MNETTFRAPRDPLVGPGGIDCHVRDMTATFSADVTLAAAQAKLAEVDQWLPIDGNSASTLGNLVESNSTGPLRLGYGAWRDLLLAVQLHNGRGELITAGVRTVKNVAGYDLPKFMVGQRGIFGRLVTITTRTYRRPQGALLARFAPDVGIVNRLVPGSLRPQWAMLTKDALLCGLLGDARTLEFYVTAVPRAEPLELVQRSLVEDVAHREQLWSARGPIDVRASVPPMRIVEFARSLDANWVADAAFGVVLASARSREQIVAIREAASRVGGSARFYDGTSGAPIELSTTEAERRIMERLKDAFDPDHRLNPLPWQHS